MANEPPQASVLTVILPRSPAAGTTRPFRFRRRGMREEGVLVVHGNGVAAYRNVCAHADAPLDMGDGAFFDEDGRHLRCRLHGALYRPEDGVCVAGPCVGASLESFEVERRGGQARIRLAPGDEPDRA